MTARRVRGEGFGAVAIGVLLACVPAWAQTPNSNLQVSVRVTDQRACAVTFEAYQVVFKGVATFRNRGLSSIALRNTSSFGAVFAREAKTVLEGGYDYEFLEGLWGEGRRH